MEKTKRIWTEEEIVEKIEEYDFILYRALYYMYNQQTEDEKRCGDTTHRNGIGYSGADARIMTSITEFMIERGYLSRKQKEIARGKIVKYRKQLTKIANNM